MRCLFVVQGEGRGHMTQAIAMKHILEEAGHAVCATLVGQSPRREIPPFFVDRMGVDVHPFQSPNFVSDADTRGILVGRSFGSAIARSPSFFQSFGVFSRALKTYRPDLVINFYDPLWGVYLALNGKRSPSVCVAHQCLSLHHDFPFPDGHLRDKMLLKTLTRTAALRSSIILGLSFTPFPAMTKGRLHVVPPLIRPDLFTSDVGSGNYLLVYLMSHGYAADVVAWHEQHKDVPLHCFWDRKGAPDIDRRDETLSFYRLDDVRFISMMSGCRGLVTTAGFESVCEAMYLGKPVLMVPVHGHYEQLCNAVDGERAGAGIRADGFDLDRFVDYIASHDASTDTFRNWVQRAPELIVRLLEQAV